jgi:hypothetical protein
MKRIAIVVAVMALVGCANDPVASSASNNPQVKVDLLFEHEGVRVYRFWDAGHHRYYAIPRDGSATSVESGFNQSCGKGCTKYVPIEIPTAARR